MYLSMKNLNRPAKKLTVFILLALLLLPLENLAQEYLLRSVVDQGEGHVDQPFQLKLKFYWKDCCVRGPVISVFDIATAEVSTSEAPVQYIEEINGNRMGVYETTYLVTPKVPGVLLIPTITLSGERIPSDNIFNPPEDEITSIEVSSDPVSVLILD